MCQIKIQTTVKMFYILEIYNILGCISHRINCIDQSQGPLNTTADFGAGWEEKGGEGVSY